MNRIELRGVIVPSFYDNDWARPYIDKGLITPESVFRRALAAADPGEPLDIYINSPGGSVFAAYEMVNAIREWKAANGQKANVTLGAMAASAASALAIMAGSTIRSHRNTKMMFHGAMSETWAGKQGHEDAAELLGKINADIQQVLIQRYGINADVVAEWFAEGREGWLSADEMAQAGIVSEIISDDSEVIRFNPDELDAVSPDGMGIAALLECDVADVACVADPEENAAATDEATEEEAADVDDQPADDGAEDAGDAGDEPGNDVVAEDGGADDDAPADQSTADYERGFADGEAAARARALDELGEQAEQWRQRAQNAEKHASLLNSQRDKLAAQLEQQQAAEAVRVAALHKALDEANDRLRQHLSASLNFAPAVETWEDAMRACGGVYEKAAKAYPHLLEQFRARARQRQN